MEGFLHHMAPQFLHPALQGFGCGAFRPIAAAGSFHPLYPSKAFARHLGEQYALGQSVGQALRGAGARDESATPPLYRHGYAAALAAARDDTSSPGSAASASPRPCKDEDSAAAVAAAQTCADAHHDFFTSDGERKSSCGVCGTRLGPGVAQAHFLQELQHLYSLSALPRDSAAAHAHTLHHQDEDARWETYQRIRANRQRRLKMRTRKRHHTVESMLGYDLEEAGERESAGARDAVSVRDAREAVRDLRPSYDAEDEPVDVEGDSLGWPDATVLSHVEDKGARIENDKLRLSYAEDLEISSTNDAMQSPERVRIETPRPAAAESGGSGGKMAAEAADRPMECVSTSEPWPLSTATATTAAAAAASPHSWPALAAEAYLHAAAQHKIDGENLPSSTDPRN